MFKSLLGAVVAIILAGCATAPAGDPCRSLSDFAAQVTKDKADGYPQPYTLEYYRAQVAGDAGHFANVTAIVQGVYQRGEAPDAVYRKCKVGAYK